MRVIGIDPGSIKAGFSILEKNSKEPIHISSGSIVLDDKLPVEKRLLPLFEDVCFLIKKYQVSEMAIENVFFAKNAQSALKLGQARGVILLAAAQANIPVFQYAPTEIKNSVSGSGRADKQQIEHMIRFILKLPKSFEFKSPDHSDALAIGLTHLQSNQQRISPKDSVFTENQLK